MNLLPNFSRKSIRLMGVLFIMTVMAVIGLTLTGCDRQPTQPPQETESTTETQPHIHAVKAWEITREPTLLEDGERVGLCDCGEEMREVIPCPTASIPRIYLNGSMEGMSQDDKVPLEIAYESEEINFTGVAMTDIQGSSSAAYNKKNYNIRLYTDDTVSKKLKVNLGWGKESKYCLKANYVDATQARNIVTARLWTEMLSTRAGVPEQLASSPCGGVIDGFPVIVYHDGEMLGLYTLNIPKDEWMFNIHGDDTGAVLFCSNWDDTGYMRAPHTEEDTCWELKYESDDLKGKTFDRLNELIAFLDEADDTTFLNRIDEYIDLDSVIDYILLLAVTGADDNKSKNALYVTYDGLKFYISPYDLDTAWGLYWDGTFLRDWHSALIYPEGDHLNTYQGNLLFKRVGVLCSERIVKRYAELRTGVLSTAHIKEAFKAFSTQIPDELYALDWKLNPGIPSTDENTLSAIFEWIDKRLDKGGSVYVTEKHSRVEYPSLDELLLPLLETS